MTACAVPLSELAISRSWKANFLRIMPAVKTHAGICFRRLNPTDQEEATAETIARACLTYATLARQRKLAQVYTSNIATNAVRAVKSDRHVGGRQSSRDVMSPLTHKKKGISVGSLSPWSGKDDTWRDLTLESKRVSPADQACFNLDFQDWLKTWPQRHRQIIAALAAGHRAWAVADKFGITEGRMSQLRAEYRRSWEQFQNVDSTVKVA